MADQYDWLSDQGNQEASDPIVTQAVNAGYDSVQNPPEKQRINKLNLRDRLEVLARRLSQEGNADGSDNSEQ